MEKKSYIKPAMEITLLEGEVLMQPASAPGIVEGDEATDGEVLSNGRRGTWGNLWD